MMKTTRSSLLVSVLMAFAPACAKNSVSKPQSSAANPGAVQPDPARARARLAEHVTYPATRSQVLDACAHTREFSDAEKQWFSHSLPEGQYASAQEVISALKLDEGCNEPAVVACGD